MKINKLGIKGFGKFKNKDIQFTNGINLVYGENEAGKSTTHKFIQGMFFGFFKPYSKNKIYSEDYEKYKPWNGNVYKGSLDFTSGKSKYRIERNFDKKNEKFKLLDGTTGKDLTEKLPYDKSTKQRIISPVIKLNSVLFNNTISISQMGNRTEAVFKKEIVETLANYEKGNNNNISVNKALDILNKQKSEIGTKRQSKSKYGKAVLELEELNSKKKSIEATLIKNRDNYIRLKELGNELKNARLEKRKIVNKINSFVRNREKNAFYKVSAIEADNEKLKEQILELKRYKDISNDLYEEFVSLYSEHKSLKQQLAELEAKQKAVMEAMSDIDKESAENRKLTNGKSYNKILNDIDILEDRLGNIQRLQGRLSDKKDETVEKDYSSKGTVNKVINVLCMVAVVVSAFMLAFSFTISKSLMLYFYIALATTAVLALIKVIVLIVYKETSKQYVKYDTSLIRTQNMIELNEVEINKLLKEYEEDNPYNLIEVLKEKANLAKDMTQTDSKAMKYEMDNDDLTKDINQTKEKIGNVKYQMNMILRRNGISNISELKEGIEKRERYALLLEKYNTNELLLQNISETYDIEKLKEKFANETVDKELLKQISDEDADVALEYINEKISKISNEVSRINGKLEEVNSSENELCVIDENINKLKKSIAEYEWKINVIDEAIATIGNISEDIHKNAAPSLNTTLGNIMSKITNGKYSTVKVDENMNVMVLDHNSGEMVDAEKLSNGTIDQIYLALRFSIIDNLLLSDKMPVILDDCFVQYDDTRLKEILLYLNSIAQKRQVIMFSCHAREENILKSLGIQYNKIQL